MILSEHLTKQLGFYLQFHAKEHIRLWFASVITLVQELGKYIEDVTCWREDMNFMFEWQEQLERLSMTFTADGKRQRLPVIFYSFLVILE